MRRNVHVVREGRTQKHAWKDSTQVSYTVQHHAGVHDAPRRCVVETTAQVESYPHHAGEEQTSRRCLFTATAQVASSTAQVCMSIHETSRRCFLRPPRR